MLPSVDILWKIPRLQNQFFITGAGREKESSVTCFIWLRATAFMKLISVDFKTGFLALAAAGLCSSGLLAQPSASDTLPTDAPVLRVLARNIEPFCFEKGGRRTGFAVDLWTEISKVAGFRYEVQEAESAQALVDALAAKKGDVGLGALSITAQREQVMDFSYPFYNSGLDIITSTEGSSVFGMIRDLFNAQLLKSLGLFMA